MDAVAFCDSIFMLSTILLDLINEVKEICGRLKCEAYHFYLTDCIFVNRLHHDCECVGVPRAYLGPIHVRLGILDRIGNQPEQLIESSKLADPSYQLVQLIEQVSGGLDSAQWIS